MKFTHGINNSKTRIDERLAYFMQGHYEEATSPDQTDINFNEAAEIAEAKRRYEGWLAAGKPTAGF